jgi:hypothetical protein
MAKTTESGTKKQSKKSSTAIGGDFSKNVKKGNS